MFDRGNSINCIFFKKKTIPASFFWSHSFPLQFLLSKLSIFFFKKRSVFILTCLSLHLSVSLQGIGQNPPLSLGAMQLLFLKPWIMCNLSSVPSNLAATCSFSTLIYFPGLLSHTSWRASVCFYSTGQLKSKWKGTKSHCASGIIVINQCVVMLNF